jgi:hypothetical protein
MARERVTEKGIGESADAVWKRLVAKQELENQKAGSPTPPSR